MTVGETAAAVSEGVTVAGKTAVVMGGTSGIGESIALGFAEDGADVVATSRTSESVAETAEMIRERGAETVEQTCDVADRDLVERFRDVVLTEFGSVDILVNSAGIAARESFLELDPESWQRVVDVQLTGVFNTTQLFAREMDAGSIVNISSMSASLARSELAPYCAAKAGVNEVTRCAAKELAPDVRVNAIAPGFIETPMTAEAYAEGTDRRDRIQERTPMGRIGQPEEVVGCALYLASDAASFMTGEVVYLDGGFTRSAL